MTNKRGQDLKYPGEKGFTLIELMLVIIIIGVLAAMVMPRLLGRGEQAKVAAAKSDVSSAIPMAIDLFEVDNGRLPTSEEGIVALRAKPSGLDTWKGPYIKKTPVDPWGRAYFYRVPGSHDNDYDVYSAGPNSQEGDADDVGNWEAAAAS